jgi:hypothetical protein
MDNTTYTIPDVVPFVRYIFTICLPYLLSCLPLLLPHLALPPPYLIPYLPLPLRLSFLFPSSSSSSSSSSSLRLHLPLFASSCHYRYGTISSAFSLSFIFSKLELLVIIHTEYNDANVAMGAAPLIHRGLPPSLSSRGLSSNIWGMLQWHSAISRMCLTTWTTCKTKSRLLEA